VTWDRERIWDEDRSVPAEQWDSEPWAHPTLAQDGDGTWHVTFNGVTVTTGSLIEAALLIADGDGTLTKEGSTFTYLPW